MLDTKQIEAAMKRGQVELRTRYGGWRFVVALYDDGTVGTVRAEGNSAGTWRIQPLKRFIEMRSA